MSRVALACAAPVFAMAVLAGCAEKEMGASDAREFTRRALESVGLEDVRVDDRAEAAVFRPASGQRLDVWETSATVDGGRVQLAIDRESDRAVFLNDVADDGGALLTDEQFRSLERFRLNPATERHRDRVRVPAGVAFVLAAVAASGLGIAVGRGAVPFRRTRRLGVFRD